MFIELIESAFLVEREFSLVGGWIHPDGSLELFETPYEPGDHDFSAWERMREEYGERIKSKFRAYKKYQEEGHIRYVGRPEEEVDVELAISPTSSQMRTIGKLVREATSFHYSIVYSNGSMDNGTDWAEFIKDVSEMGHKEKGRLNVEGR